MEGGREGERERDEGHRETLYLQWPLRIFIYFRNKKKTKTKKKNKNISLSLNFLLFIF
jgi:hypothetical protein